jgi:hypothetical protein
MSKSITTAAAAVCAVVLSFSSIAAQGPGGPGGGGRGAAAPAVKYEAREISGYWMLPPDARDGRLVPDAPLLPAVTPQKLAEVAAKDRETVRYCRQIGLPAAMALGSPYNIRVSPELMVVISEYAPAQNRNIFLNRKEHIPDEAYDRGVYGDSIARWEGDVLVVDTTMFDPERGILSIPGGGFRSADAKLVERFRLLKNGQVLQVVSTWTDANVFRAPHTYEYRFNRMPPDYDGKLGSGCDPYDEERVAFLGKMKP